MKTKCQHSLPDHLSIFGKVSTMLVVEEKRYYSIIKCKECNHAEEIKKHQGAIKIRSSSADGQRKDQISTHWRDLLQTVNPDGSENKAFTQEFGYNPSSKNPRVLKQAPKQITE